MNILVTAFDPFGGESVNPAQQSVEGLASSIGQHSITKLVVPTVFGDAAKLVTDTMDQLRPEAVICVGQAGGRRSVTPERVAINIMDANIKDNAGEMPQDEPVVVGGPAAYFSTLPIKKMVQAIRDVGYPADVSNSAGTFVCNSLLYSVLHHAAVHMPDTRAVFIHVPYIPEQTIGKENVPSMPLESIIAALSAAIACL